jgi:hypothetical protein
MNVPSPDEFSKELLAAYADGELDADGRALVERELADHPEARDDLRAQRELSATNTVLWEAAGPPEPTSAAWGVVRREIEAELNSPEPQTVDRSRGLRVAGWLTAGLTMSAAAAAALWLSFASTVPQPRIEPHKPAALASNLDTYPEIAPAPRIRDEEADALAAIAVLPIPTDDEVVLDRVPDLEGGWLPVGRHPVPGIISLVTVEELTLEEDVSPSRALPTNVSPKMTTTAGDVPMIYAAKPR